MHLSQPFTMDLGRRARRATRPQFGIVLHELHRPFPPELRSQPRPKSMKPIPEDSSNPQVPAAELEKTSGYVKRKIRERKTSKERPWVARAR